MSHVRGFAHEDVHYEGQPPPAHALARHSPPILLQFAVPRGRGQCGSVTDGGRVRPVEPAVRASVSV